MGLILAQSPAVLAAATRVMAADNERLWFHRKLKLFVLGDSVEYNTRV